MRRYFRMEGIPCYHIVDIWMMLAWLFGPIISPTTIVSIYLTLWIYNILRKFTLSKKALSSTDSAPLQACHRISPLLLRSRQQDIKCTSVFIVLEQLWTCFRLWTKVITSHSYLNHFYIVAISQYGFVAMFMLLVYDHLLTIYDEVCGSPLVSLKTKLIDLATDRWNMCGDALSLWVSIRIIFIACSNQMGEI